MGEGRCRASCARRCGYSLFRKGIRGGYLFHSCYHLVAERVQVESLHGLYFAIHEKRSTLSCRVPQHQAYAGESFKQRDPTHVLELRMVVQHTVEAIVGNAATQMVHVMHADVGREPAQKFWQFVMRASVQSGFVHAHSLS
jgi:hypothetical protein